jgi:hypothetical protein
MASGIDTQYPLPHVHFQNEAAEALIKQIQIIAKPMLMLTQLPVTAWGHAVLHAASLLKYHPFAFKVLSKDVWMSSTSPYHETKTH